MTDLISVVNQFLTRNSNSSINRLRAQIDTIRASMYMGLSDNEVKSAIDNTLNGHPLGHKRYSLIDIIKKFIGFFSIFELDETIAKHIALGVEVFSRVPADLPSGSSLFKEQIFAALAMNGRCIIQMETGEGKTYAILPAAFSLFVKYRKVYIVCANEYLAKRDARRTKEYWDYLGLSVGLVCQSNNKDINWSADIIYTTTYSLTFKYLWDAVAITKPQNPIDFTACIIDEVDAVLMGQSHGSYSIVRYVKSDQFKWSFANEYAQKLSLGEDIEVNYATLTGNLTELGYKKIDSEVDLKAFQLDEYQVLYRAIEVSYIAMCIVQENKDYVIENDTIYPFDSITGKVNYSVSHDWMIPLEIHKGYVTRPETITLNEITPNVILKKFEHMTGLSGSAEVDSLEYFTSYFLPTIIVPRRKKRHDGVKTDMIYRTKEISTEQLSKEAVRISTQEKRPVLIGCQDIYSVKEVEAKISNMIDDQITLYTILGLKEEDIAEIFNNAGEVGVIVISTQLGGRGIDIRLSDEAKANGGLALLSLEHSTEFRNDMQFLGRGGRQDDPFTARFYVSIEDKLLQIFGSKNIIIIMDKLGMEDEEVIDSKMVTKAITGAQRRYRRNQYLSRMTSFYQEGSMFLIYDDYFKWMQMLRDSYQDSDKWRLNDFVQLILRSYVNSVLKPYVPKMVTVDDAIKIENLLTASIGFKPKKFFIESIADHNDEFVISYIENNLRETISAILNDIQSSLKKSKRWINQFENHLAEIEEVYDACTLLLNNSANDDVSEIANFEKENFFKTIINDLSAACHSDFHTELLDIAALPHGDQSQIVVKLNVILNFLQSYKSTKLLEEKQHIENERLQVSLHTNRDLINTLYYSLENLWVEFLLEKNRIIYQISRKNSDIEYYRLYGERVPQAWEKTKTRMPEYVLRNLLLLSCPSDLDRVFWNIESEVSWKKHKSKDELSNWKFKPSKRNHNAKSDKNELITNLVHDFISRYCVNIEIIKSRAIEFMLSDFLKNNPISYLQSEKRLYQAITENFQKQTYEGVPEKRRKFNQFWLKKFLSFMHTKGLICSLPTLRTHLIMHVNYLLKNITNLNSSLYVGKLILVLISLLGLGYFWRSDKSISLAGNLYYIDQWISAGLFSNGSVVSVPIIGVLFSRAMTPQRNFWSHTYCAAIAIILGAIMLWTSSGIPGVLQSIAGIIFLTLLSVKLNNEIHDNTQYLGLNLIKIWILITLLIFTYTTMFSSLWFSVSILGLGLFYFIWYRSVNIGELIFESLHFSKSAYSMEHEKVCTGYTVRGSDSFPYLLGFTFTFGLFCVLDIFHIDFVSFSLYGLPIYEPLIILTYTLLALYSSLTLIKAKLSTKKWSSFSIKNGSTVCTETKVDSSNSNNLKEILTKMSCHFALKEFTFLFLSIGGLSALFYQKTLSDSSYPISLIIITCAVVLGEYLYKALKDIRNLLFYRKSSTFDIMDFSNIPEPEDDMEDTLVNRIKKFFDPSLKGVKIVKTVVSILATIAAAYYFLKENGFI